jgi:MGT family glycosyltransferase
MSNILFAVTPLAGHVNPLLPVAKHLKGEGPAVFFATSDSFKKQIEQHELRFLPLLDEANYDHHHMEEVVPELRGSASPNEQANWYIKRVFGDRIVAQYASLQHYIGKYEIDIIMVDVLYMGSLPLLLRRALRPPLISCGVIVPYWQDPAFSVFDGPDDSAEGHMRNIEHAKRFDEMRRPGYSHIDGVLESLGVAVAGGFTGNVLYELPDVFLQFGAEVFEYPVAKRRPNVHFVGPILARRNHTGTQPAEHLFEADDGKPVVFVTQGTLANYDFEQLINPAIRGLAEEDVHVVVSAGGSKRKPISSPNAVVHSYIEYEDILPRTHVFVTNGGYNGVQQALSFGVPIVAAGESEDKPLVNQRVASTGVGIDLKTGSPSPDQIRNAVREILAHTTYSDHARVLGAEIAKTDALRSISEIVKTRLSNQF